jgi:hypothetical protein
VPNLLKRVVAVAGWDNRCPIDADVAEQIQLALSNGVYVSTTVTVSVLVQATMTNPNGGSNQIVLELMVPSGTLNSDIITLVTNAIQELNLPTVPSITITSVTVF